MIAESDTRMDTPVQKGTPSFLDLDKNAPCDNVARGQFGIGMEVDHETMAGTIDEGRALAAQRFRRQRRGIAADVDGGRVELHEFSIGNDGTGARRHGEAEPARFSGIGGDTIEMANAAGRQDDRAGGKLVPSAFGITQHHADHAAIMGDEIFHRAVFQDLDGGRLAHARDQRLHDGLASHVALHAHNTTLAMGGLA